MARTSELEPELYRMRLLLPSGAHGRSRLALLLAGLLLLGPLISACTSTPKHPSTSPTTQPGGAIPSGSPTGPIVALHFDADQHPFFNLTRDLQLVGQAFNTVIIPAGLPALVRQARDAGLRVILDPDLKAAFHSPQGVGPMVQSVITQVRSEPGEIWGIRVADRLNDKLSTDQQLKFLSETAAVFRRELPGVHVFADVSNWELACGIPGQVSCQKYVNTQFRYETNADLLALYHSGYLDGFMLALDVKGHNRTVQLSAWRKARAMFPHPFLLFARNAGLSFPEQSYPGDASTAATGVAGAYRIPFAAGVDGVDLWAWHRLFRGTERTFLNKNGSSNPLWAAMVSEAATLHAQARPANAAA